jgi:WD40 repeat protein
MLFSASPDKSIILWDIAKSSPATKLLGHSDKVYCVKVSGDNKLVASAGEGG